jgi:hypothetical protein
METYVTAGTKIQLGKYEENQNAKVLDKAMALASDHVKLDTQQVFAQVVPALQKLGEMMKQFQPQPPMDAESQAVLQASMAETQRRAARDQAEMAHKQKELETKVAMNAEDNLTTERMKTADITADELKLRNEQEKTAMELNLRAQRELRSE